MRTTVAILVCTLLLLACAPIDQPTNTTDQEPIVIDRGEEVTSVGNYTNYSVIVTGVEGEIITLQPDAIDPDGDNVTYTYSDPFNASGQWRTQPGDEGEYDVTITARDGTGTTSQTVLVKVYGENQPPRMTCPETIRVLEGDHVNIDCDIEDPENDEVVTIYRGWINTSLYHTDYDDAGTYEVEVTSWDKQNVNERIKDTVTIIVENNNREPTITFNVDDTIDAKEGELISIDPTIDDPDGDVVQYTCTAPLGTDCTWQTNRQDAGEYNVTFTATDGTNTITKNFTINLANQNQAPQLDAPQTIRVDEGETIDLDLDATDPDGDDLTVIIDGYMTTETHTTSYDDAYPGGCGTKGCTIQRDVHVRISDGEATINQSITIFIQDKNRPPVFRIPA